MKRLTPILFILVIAALLLACGTIRFTGSEKSVTPSKVIITEERPVSGFTAIEMGSFGNVTITQSGSESLTIKGSDNVVPLIRTSVSNGVLVIETQEDIIIKTLNFKDVLTFDIQVKDLTALTIGGLGDIQMDALSTTALKVEMSGAGRLVLNDLIADSLDINLSGLGDVEIAGKVTQQTIEISGAGEVKNGDLECQIANIKVPGLGGATVWVTEQLTGDISGGGSVSYYGDPALNTESTGLGKFKPLGSK